MTLLALFFGFIQVTLFCIGGGYAALPVIKNVVIDHYGWLTITQFADLVGISEMTPGPIILNAATFVGSHVAGLPGAVMATAGCIVSPAVIVSVIAYFYFKYNKLSLVKSILNMLRPAVAALIASAGLSMIVLTFFGEGGFPFDPGSINWTAVVIFLAALAALLKLKANPTLVMLGCGILGGVAYTFL